MLEDILNYQKLDSKLVKLERDLKNDESKKTVTQMVSIVKDSQNKLMSLEQEAEIQVKELSRLKDEYNKLLTEINDIIKTDVSDADENTIRTTADKINQMSSSLTVIERKISTYNDKANNILKAFDNAKKSILNAKQKHKEAKEKYDAKQAAVNPEIESIKKELSSLESKVNKDLMAKYKRMRGDNIFPVFVPLRDGSCGGCMMGVSQANIQQIKTKGYIECEQCHRIIYIP